MVECGRCKQFGLVGIVRALTGEKNEFYVQGLCRRGKWEMEAREWMKKAMEGANKEGGRGEKENGEERWREEWESGKKVQRLEESRKGGKRGLKTGSR